MTRLPPPGPPKRILHAHSSFSLGGKEARATRLMNLFGASAAHVVLSAVPDALGARNAIDPAIAVSFPGEAAPALHGRPGLSRYRALAAYMAGFDLVLSYNWGSMDAVMAHRMGRAGLLGSAGRSLPPLIHHEDGFNADESVRLNWKRNAFRRQALKSAARLIVPSRTLERIALGIWGMPVRRLERIANGIDVAAYRARPAADAIPGFVRRPGELIVGTIAGLRPVKNLAMMVQSLHHVPPHVRLILVGEGPEMGPLQAQAAALGVADRVLFPGFLPLPQRYIGHFDIFALTSHSEQFPIALVEAMAAARPVAATDVGDVAAMVAEANRPFITPPGDLAAFAQSLNILASAPGMRSDIGIANERRAAAEYEEAQMLAAYARLYGLPLPAADKR